jgi:uncharacterized protein YciI
MDSDNRRRDFMRLGVAAALILQTGAAASTETAPVPVNEAIIAFLVIYRPGPAWPKGKPLADLPLRDHGRYMIDLYRRGAMKLAGRFEDGSGGAVLLHTDGIDTARGIADADPAVVNRIFVYELVPWRLMPWARLARAAGP